MWAHILNTKIIYEDDNFLAVNKPAGLLVHPVRGRPALGTATTALGRSASNGVHGTPEHDNKGTLVDFLVSKYPEIKEVGDLPAGRQAVHLRPGIVHRLDKDTSGVMIVAKNQKYFEYLKNLFQTHKIRKTYIALVHGKVKERKGVINKPIGLKSGTTKRTVFVRNAVMVKSAETEYQLKKYLNIGGEDYSLLEVFPKTGRTHQIRVHLASIGHPIVGDRLYGNKKASSVTNRLFLHADSIEFEKAPGEKIRLSADLPKELSEIIDRHP